jgi:formate dehydrogenase iron-sulfur subunit
MAQTRLGQLQRAGETRASLYGVDEHMLGGLNSFYLLVDRPEVYGLPPDPQIPSRNLKPSAIRAVLGSVALVLTAMVSFRNRGTRDV